jgi:hypothetical protein
MTDSRLGCCAMVEALLPTNENPPCQGRVGTANIAMNQCVIMPIFRRYCSIFARCIRGITP